LPIACGLFGLLIASGLFGLSIASGLLIKVWHFFLPEPASKQCVALKALFPNDGIRVLPDHQLASH